MPTARSFRHALGILTLMSCILPTLVVAAEEPPAGEYDDTEVYTLRHLDPNDVPPTLRLMGVEFWTRRDSRHVVLVGTTERLAAASALLAELDVPRPRTPAAALTFYVYQAVRDGDTGETLPGDVARVLPGSADYRLLDSFFLHTTDGTGGQVAGVLSIGGEELPSAVQFSKALILPAERGGTVMLRGLQFSALRAMLRTDVELRQDRATLVGRTSPGGDHPTILLVAACRIDS